MIHRPYGVQYEAVSPEYLEQRQLRKGVGVVLLWALGVGAVISGNFFWLELWIGRRWYRWSGSSYWFDGDHVYLHSLLHY